jgi:hypothetical protein
MKDTNTVTPPDGPVLVDTGDLQRILCLTGDELRGRLESALSADPVHFGEQALRYLAEEHDTGAVRNLVHFLYASGAHTSALTNPKVPLQLCVKAATHFDAVDPFLERRILAAAQASPGPSGERLVRALEIIELLPEAAKSLPIFRDLSRHWSVFVRSKATLLIGRFHQNQSWLANWVRRQLQDTDHRVRANAVEGLWRAAAPGIEDVLRIAASDSHHRVAANALVGLYGRVPHESIPLIEEMTRHSSPQFRAAAAFVIGKALDPHFVDALSVLLQDADATVRRRAFQSLLAVKASVAQASGAPSAPVMAVKM